MRKRTSLRSLFLIVLSIGLWTTLRGQQVTLYASHEAGEPGETVKVDIRVADFDTMLSAQFTIYYDSLLLEFVDVGDFGIFNITNQYFGVPEGGLPTPKGVITFLWIADNIITGYSLPDSSRLFTVSFKLIGNNGQVAEVEFPDDVNTPTPPEFGNLSGEIDYQLYNGSVTIGSTATSEEIVTDEFIFSPITPNPIDGEAFVRFYLQQSSRTQIDVYDIAGNPVYQHMENYGSGWQAISLQEDLFPAAGTYFVRLHTENAQAVQTLIVTR